jgi:tetratricopeptide (TPR) repeat protein
MSEALQRQVDSLQRRLHELYEAGLLEQAIPVARELRDLQRQRGGEALPDFATSLNNLAVLYHEMGDHAAALPLYRQALEVRRTALGEDRPHFALRGGGVGNGDSLPDRQIRRATDGY